MAKKQFYAAESDLKAIDQLSNEDRVDALYYYLIEGWNMAEVGQYRLGITSSQPGQLVSSLTRCYGFTGQNGGKYRNKLKSYEAIEEVVLNYLDRPSQKNGPLPAGAFDQAVREYLQDQQPQNDQPQQTYQTYTFPSYTGRPPQLNFQLSEQKILGSVGGHININTTPEPTTITACLQRAKEELAKGNKNKSCSYYFKAGDMAFDNEDYKQANDIYQEAMRNTGLKIKDHIFNIAYSYSKTYEPLDEQEHRNCIAYYRQGLDEGETDDALRVNLAYHYNSIKEYQNSIIYGLPAAQRGEYPIIFKTLANAYYATKQWKDAVYWYEKSAASGENRNAYRIACALEYMEEYDDAKEEFEALLYDPNEDEDDIYEHLLAIAEDNYETSDVIGEYHLKLLELGSWRHSCYGKEWLEHAMENDLDDIVEQMRDLMPDIADEFDEDNAISKIDDVEWLAGDSVPEINSEEMLKILLPYKKWADRHGYALSMEQYVWLARAQATELDYSEAREAYFKAAEMAYKLEDYKKADAFFREGIQETYSDSGADFFHVAYAHSKATDEPVDDDYRYCIKYYKRYLELYPNDDAARGNIGLHYQRLGEFDSAIEWILPLAKKGSDPQKMQLVANLYYKTEQWADAAYWFEKYADAGKERFSSIIASAWEKCGEYRKALEEYKQLIDTDDDKDLWYKMILLMAEKCDASIEEVSKYRLRYMQECSVSEYETERWLLEAEENDLTYIATQMLNCMPNVKARREQEEMERLAEEERIRMEEEKRLAEEKRKRDEEEFMLLLF